MSKGNQNVRSHERSLVKVVMTDDIRLRIVGPDRSIQFKMVADLHPAQRRGLRRNSITYFTAYANKFGRWVLCEPIEQEYHGTVAHNQ